MVPSNSPTALDDAQWQFLMSHSDRGKLRIQVSTARGAFPVSQATIAVSRPFGNVSRILYQGTTDISGILQDLTLPALPKALSQNPATADNSGTLYRVSVYHPGYAPVELRGVTIFSNIETILPVLLEPTGEM